VAVGLILGHNPAMTTAQVAAFGQIEVNLVQRILSVFSVLGHVFLLFTAESAEAAEKLFF
jgi:hypothetical protein